MARATGTRPATVDNRRTLARKVLVRSLSALEAAASCLADGRTLGGALVAVALATGAAGCEARHTGGSMPVRMTERARSRLRVTAGHAIGDRGHAGTDVCLRAEVVPSRSVATAGGDALEVGVDVTIGCARRESAIAVGVEIVRDTGGLVAPPSRATARLAEAVSDASWSAQLPTLDDGFYVVRATAVRVDALRAGATTVVPEAPAESAMAELYLHADAGRVTVIDQEEYFERSRANEGRVL